LFFLTQLNIPGARRCLEQRLANNDTFHSTMINDATMHGTMLGVKIDRRDPTLLHQQVAAEIRRAIADGEAKPGERLPPAKDLAAVLDVNTNTVLRALRELRGEGLLEFRRGRGITVAGTPEQGAVVARARELVAFARQHGYRPDEVIQIIHDLA
jgi:GntR family transcriptional regulator